MDPHDANGWVALGGLAARLQSLDLRGMLGIGMAMNNNHAETLDSNHLPAFQGAFWFGSLVCLRSKASRRVRKYVASQNTGEILEQLGQFGGFARREVTVRQHGWLLRSWRR